MSGKSTFLRTIGINAVLALAGAPVHARRMRISPLALGATLRIQDSLQKRAARASRRRSSASSRSWTCRAGRSRSCSCSTKSSPGRTRTTAALGAKGVICGLAAQGRDRPGDDARPHSDAHRRRASAGAAATSTSPTSSTRARLQFDYQLHPGRRQEQQRAGADAGGRAGGVTDRRAGRVNAPCRERCRAFTRPARRQSSRCTITGRPGRAVRRIRSCDIPSSAGLPAPRSRSGTGRRLERL